MTFITPRKVFAHLDRLAAWQNGAAPAPVTIEWDLSNRCSLGCQSCHFAHTHTRGPWTVRDRRLPMAFDNGGDLADTALVLRALEQMRDAGVKGIVWTGGGEPTLHPDWLEIVIAAAELGLEQGMYTLGGHFTPESAAALASVASWVVVSLDADEPGIYAAEKGVPPARFDDACRGLKWLAETGGAVVGASFLLHSENWQRAPRMLALARALGATYSTFRPTIETSPDRPDVVTGDREWISVVEPMLEHLSREPDVELDVARFREYRDWVGRSYGTCYGIRLNATVTPDGRVWVCPNRRGMPGSCVGDLRRESFVELWARHAGAWTDFSSCRVMCRLHRVNEELAPIFESRPHEAFV